MLNSNQTAKPLSVLIVDDEASIRDLVIQVLELKYQVYSATNSAEALRIAKEHKPSFILADIYMPGLNGIDLCRLLREDDATKNIPVMIMTARNSLETRIKSFESGADDFLEKPFYMDELLTRIESKIRKYNEVGHLSEKSSVTSLQDLSLDYEALRATIADQPIDLGYIEFKILSLLVRKAGNLVTRENIEQAVWGDEIPATRSLDTHIASLRRKLGASKKLQLRTVYGEGFILQAKADTET